MRYAQLRAFHHVALHGGFSRAAAALSLTQPAISDQIRRLERERDVLLFHRDRKQVRLTGAGERLFRLTREMFEVEERIDEMLSESRAEVEGVLRVMADSALHVVDVLGEFRAAHPKVFVSVRAGNTAEVLASLGAYEAEIGVAGAVPRARDLEVVDLGRSPIVAFAARGTFPAGKTSLSLAELTELPLVFREDGSTTRSKLQDAAAAAGVTLRPAIEAEGREAVREIVAAGLGVGFVSTAEFSQDDRVAAYPVSDLDLAMEEAVVCLSQRSDVRVIRAFMALAGRRAGMAGG